MPHNYIWFKKNQFGKKEMHEKIKGEDRERVSLEKEVNLFVLVAVNLLIVCQPFYLICLFSSVFPSFSWLNLVKQNFLQLKKKDREKNLKTNYVQSKLVFGK